MPQNAQELHSQIDEEKEEEGEDGRGKIQDCLRVGGKQKFGVVTWLSAPPRHSNKVNTLSRPPFSQTHGTRMHTHAHTPTGKELKERGGCFSPTRRLLVHRLGDEVEKALGILLGVHR